MTKRLLLISCLFGASAVILGAFGAHILKHVLNEADLQIYKTGVEYQFYHTFAILGAALISRYASKHWTKIAGNLFIAGIVCFSGSLYLLAIADAFDMSDAKSLLGPITPVGGLLLIGGWVSLFYAATKYKERSHSGTKHMSRDSSSKKVEQV